MPRYIVERTFTEGLRIPTSEEGAKACLAVICSKSNVTWLNSYVSLDFSNTFCIYDGPDPESIREAASINNLPVDSITEVSVLEPIFLSRMTANWSTGQSAFTEVRT